MLIFASSDKGGTGRSVTTCNLAYHLSLRGRDVVYLDFDFGSPTAGAIFEIEAVERGADHGGLHSHLLRGAPYQSVDVLAATNRMTLRNRVSSGAGRLVLVPGDRGGGEFTLVSDAQQKTIELLRQMESEFDACFVDLSAGRSAAVEASLTALADKSLTSARVRWLVFHRWTRQHVLAASGLVFEPHGILDVAGRAGHDKDKFLHRIRTVRTAVPDLKAQESAGTGAQASWLQACDEELDDLARDKRLGPAIMVGLTPMEPMLQWREQLILSSDVAQGFAHKATFEAFARLAGDVEDDRHWEGLG